MNTKKPTSQHNTVDQQRRTVLKIGAGLGVASLGAPWIARYAHAAEMNLGPYQEAKINWRQAEGQTVNVAVIPASYFNNLISLNQQFEALTGIKVNYQKVPPGQIRQKAILDLSAKTGNISTHSGDPMYLPLYAANNWTDTLEQYLHDSKLTDNAWFQYEDIIEAWRKADMVDGKIYAIPFDGECTIQIYRKDLFDKKGLKPAETFDDIVSNAQALSDPANRLWGFCLRGMAGAGQNMYIYPSIFIAFGAKWFDENGKIRVNSPEALAALEWYITTENKYAPPSAKDWNWPDIADAFSQATVACYIDGQAGVSVIADPARSKVYGNVGYARWPKGPGGRRCTSIWNWAFSINSALPAKARQATWLWIQWACAKETQIRTSYQFKGASKRFDVNRTSMWQSSEYAKYLASAGYHLRQATLESLTKDTDVDWRPRVPQWPQIGETMAKIIQGALVGQMKPKEALDFAQKQVERIMSS